MTKEQLAEFIRETTLPIVKDALGKDVADLIRQSVETSIKAQQPNYAQRMFGQDAPEAPKAEKGVALARCVRAMAAAKIQGAGPDKAIEILKSWGNEDLAVKWGEARTKAMASGDPTAGGFLVPTQFSTDVIELLRAAAVVRSLGPMTLPMPTGTVKVPKITAGTSATYIGENQNISKTQPEFGQITLTFKKLAALVPISNDLVRYSSPSADAIVRDDIVRTMAVREDYAFLRDNGTSSTPKGLKYWIHDDNKIAANASVSLANVTIDLGRCLQALADANVPLIGGQNLDNAGSARAGWIFSPRTWRYLTTLQTTTGAYAFRDEMLRGTLWGYPFRLTTQIPNTMTAAGVDTGGTQTELYFGAFAHAVIGEALGIMVDASQDAAYHDGSNVVAAFSQDQTVIRVIAEHDFALRHDKAFVLLQNITWGV